MGSRSRLRTGQGEVRTGGRKVFDVVDPSLGSRLSYSTFITLKSETLTLIPSTGG